MVLDRKTVENIAKKFSRELVDVVPINLVVSDGCSNCPFLVQLLKEIEAIGGGKIVFRYGEINRFLAKFLGVNRGPVILIGNRGEVRYTGSPLGEEAWAFIETISIFSNKRHGLDKYVSELNSLDRTVRIETIVTPTCPYCPYAVLLANKIAIASNGKVVSDTVNAYEFPEIARKFGVTSVPTVILSVEEPYSGDILSIGVPNEKLLIAKILKVGYYS